MDPNVQRFSGFADDYDQYRPELPLVIGEVLSQLAGPERPLRVVDVGCGTGLSTRLWRDWLARMDSNHDQSDPEPVRNLSVP